MRLILISLLLLAGCVPQTGSDTLESECGATDMQTLVGQPEDVLEEMRLQGPIRILGPDDAMTMDHRPDRTNIEIDEDGLINRIWCG